MGKIGILTFHYSTNYGGVLQAFALQKTLINKGYDTEIINYVPSTYNPNSYFKSILKEIIKNKAFNINIIKKYNIRRQYNQSIADKFDNFRNQNFMMSQIVDEKSIINLLDKYDSIIVGSDQIWNPSQRNRNEYFLNYNDCYTGKKISYAADSTTKEIDIKDFDRLKNIINQFDNISVRNKHSYDFVHQLTSKEIEIVADPTILYDFNEYIEKKQNKENYILAYILGEEINGSHQEAITKIKKKYGEIPVYLITIPTDKFYINNFADKVFYDISPIEWLNLFYNATFIYTDSFHGVLFSLKFYKPFLAYYTEKMRATRFIDLASRYNIDPFIVENTDDIDRKGSLENIIDFKSIENILNIQKKQSFKFIDKVLQN